MREFLSIWNFLVGRFKAEGRLPFSELSNTREISTASSSHGTRFQDGEFISVSIRKMSKSTVIRCYRTLFNDIQTLFGYITPYCVKVVQNCMRISRVN